MSGHNYEFDISVVVPVYNVEEYLIECLDSINNQIKDKLQVIIIDDGSPDRSGEMADEYCKTHPNFECHHIENGGLGHARNYALQFAKGKYIAYIDSDDIIPPEAYQEMYNAAERNGSDMAICNVVRFNKQGFFESRLHNYSLIPVLEECTHITRDPSLLYDPLACNKLIRIDFIKKHNIKFPEKIYYEDIPTTIPMHCLVNNVSVVKTTAYYWRARDGANTSISQNISNMQNVYDRITVISMNNKFFKEHNMAPELYKAKLVKDLEYDLIMYVNNCNLLPDDVAQEVIRCVNGYISEYIDDEILDSLRLIHRQKYQHVMNNDLEGLRNLLTKQGNYYSAPVAEKDGEFYMELADELFTIPKREANADIYHTVPRKYINKFAVNSKGAKISAHVYLPRVNVPTAEMQKIEAYLYNGLTAKAVPLPIEYYSNENLTKKRGFIYDAYSEKGADYNYDGTGFRINLDFEALELTEESLGRNQILIKYHNRVRNGGLILGYSSNGTKEKMEGATVLVGDKSVEFERNEYGEVVVNVNKLYTSVSDFQFDQSSLNLTLTSGVEEVLLQGQSGDTVKANRGDELNFSVDISQLSAEEKYSFKYIDRQGNLCDLYSASKKSIIKRTEYGIALISPVKNHKPDLCIAPTLALATSVENEEGSLIVNMDVIAYGDKAAFKGINKAVLCFEDTITGKLFKLGKAKAATKSGKVTASFNMDFSNSELTANLHDCLSFLKLKLIKKNKESIMLPLLTKKAVNQKLQGETLKVRFYNHAKNVAAFAAWQIWSDDENSDHKRKALINEKYAEYRKLPINKKRIVFESMWGKKYSCNPQAIYEYIEKNYPEYECIWALNDARHPIKGNAKRVRRNSLEYYYYLATAKYLVNNVNFPDAYVKRKGQIEVQTMHGTPLKTFGLEIPGELATEKARQDFIKRNARWNYLVVQGEFTATKAFDCFGVEVPIMRTGYPRTDMLYNASEKKIAKIKKTLNIPEGKKVVLYAPTWRIMNQFDMQLDVERFRRELGEEYVLLVRIHHFSAKGYTIPADNKVIFDVNDYSSIEDLYIISDMLITDYSSALFDYAITEKPMIFYLYDIEEYAENLRGTYFDIEKEAPGPLAYNNDQLLSTIVNVKEEMDNCLDRRKAFYAKYVNYECGDSSRKVVEKMLRFRNSPLNRVRRIKARKARATAKNK